MFDVGFWELTLIATLALLVLGPDKLPGVVNGVGRMLGRARSLARGLKMQIEREMNQAATVTPTSKPRSGPKSASPKPAETSVDAGGQAPVREEQAAPPGDKPKQASEPATDDIHGDSRTAK